MVRAHSLIKMWSCFAVGENYIPRSGNTTYLKLIMSSGLSLISLKQWSLVSLLHRKCSSVEVCFDVQAV